MAQAKGSATRVVIDTESSYATPKTSSKTGHIIPFNSCDVTYNRALNTSETIRGDRNPTQPFPGNKDVGGNLVVPIRSLSFGRLMQLAIGTPSSVESPQDDGATPAGSDIKTAAGTVTISGGTGAFTFSDAQTATAVGDRVIYELSGTRYTAYITTRTNDTTGVMHVERDGTTVAPNITAATVVAICDNLADATPGTVDISSGVATFSATHSNLATGQMVIYDKDALKVGFLTKLTATTATIVDATTLKAPADDTSMTVEWLGIKSYWTHTFIIDETASLASFLLEKAFLDFSSPFYEYFTGCKVNSMQITVGGDGELLATFNVVGSDYVSGTQYDSGAVDLAGTVLKQFQASAKEGGVTSTILRELSMTMSNNLDTDQFTIGGAGARGDLPEGIAQFTGSLSAQFKETSGEALLAKADGETESALEVTFTSGTTHDSLVIRAAEVNYSPGTPGIPNAAGIVLELNWGAFYDDNADDSAIAVELTNQVAGYAA